MKGPRPATSSTALAGVLVACLSTCLLAAAPAAARPKPITGKLDRRGVTVVALAPHGSVTKAPARPGFRLVPPARIVTLQLLDRNGAYLGPVVVRGRRSLVVLGVRAGTNLGRIVVHAGYARVAHAPARRRLDSRVRSRARDGVPLGVGSLGWVRGQAHGPAAPGLDRDRDGIPDKFDVDDDGDLVLDASVRRDIESGTAPRPLALSGCPASLCSGSALVDLSDADRADLALIISIVAAVLALASLAWHLLASRRWNRRRVEVDVRLGLPIYQQGGGDWSVFIEVVNRTENPVRWVSAALELPDGRRLYLMQQHPGGELPAVLQPHDSHHTWTRCRDLEAAGLDLAEPVEGIAKLDTGEVLRSPRRRLVSRSTARRWRP